MSDETQYDDGGSAFDDADLEGEAHEDVGHEGDAASGYAGFADQEQLEQAVAETIAEFPELANEAVVAELTAHTERAAQELGDPSLAQDLDFIRAVHVARGAGAAPAPQGDEFDRALASKGAGRSALPF